MAHHKHSKAKRKPRPRIPKPKYKGWGSLGVAAAAPIVAEDIVSGDVGLIEAVEAFLVDSIAVTATADAVGVAGLPEDAPVELGGVIVLLLEIIALVLLVLVTVIIFVPFKIIQAGLGKIPIVGGKLGALFSSAISGIGGILDGVQHALTAALTDLYNAVHYLFDSFLKWENVPRGEDWNRARQHTRQQSHDIQRLQREVKHLHKTLFTSNAPTGNRLKELETFTDAIAHRLGWFAHPAANSVIPKLNRVAAELHHLQNSHDPRFRSLGHELSHMYAAIYGATGIIADVQTVRSRQRAEQKELIDLRDRVKTLEDSSGKGSGLTPLQAKQLHKAFTIASILAPLTALLPITVAQLRNLNKLKTDPCQCKGSRGGPTQTDNTALDLIIVEDGL